MNDLNNTAIQIAQIQADSITTVGWIACGTIICAVWILGTLRG